MVTEKRYQGSVNRVLYCGVLYCIMGVSSRVHRLLYRGLCYVGVRYIKEHCTCHPVGHLFIHVGS